MILITVSRDKKAKEGETTCAVGVLKRTVGKGKPVVKQIGCGSSIDAIQGMVTQWLFDRKSQYYAVIGPATSPEALAEETVARLMVRREGRGTPR